MSNRRPSATLSAGVLLQLSFAIVVAILVPLLIGIWIERTFNTGPLVILALVVIGVALGAATVYKIVKDAYAELGGR